ncbi:RING/U-box superfamily protein [Euphorbia peplus]|nr:RING/U-box superfamily protein [Euphorbia peplus]
MVSDSITPIPSAPKDFPKKKRVNRSAKLKQCKLDARREQWLSQGAVKNKGNKEELTASRCENQRKNVNLETGRIDRGNEEEEKERGLIYHDFDSDSSSNSPTGSSASGLSGTDPGSVIFTGSSSSSSGGCCSGNITEDEEEGEDNCLDDWEAVADALAANDSNKHGNKKDNQCLESEASPELEPCEDLKQGGGVGGGQETESPKLAPNNARAWRPDDAFRPQSLPNLSKQRSFPNTDRCFGKGGIPWSCINAAPSSCPICCEELDLTDTSFLPCICGFRLCLFCYNRIRNVEDGRCPGCRKPYEGNAVEAELSVNGGSLTFRLARSYSMVASNVSPLWDII